MRKASRLLLIVSVLLVVSPLALKANTTPVQDFNINLDGVATSTFSSTSQVNQFNPSLGTLTSVNITITGSADYYTYATNDSYLTFNVDNGDGTAFGTVPPFSGTSPGTYTIYVSIGSQDPLTSSFSYWEGTGTKSVSIVANPTDTNNYFTAIPNSPLSGTISYSYTPSPVPEPSSVLLLGAGLLGLVVLCGYKKRAARSARALS